MNDRPLLVFDFDGVIVDGMGSTGGVLGMPGVALRLLQRA